MRPLNGGSDYPLISIIMCQYPTLIDIIVDYYHIHITNYCFLQKWDWHVGISVWQVPALSKRSRKAQGRMGWEPEGCRLHDGYADFIGHVRWVNHPIWSYLIYLGLQKLGSPEIHLFSIFRRWTPASWGADTSLKLRPIFDRSYQFYPCLISSLPNRLHPHHPHTKVNYGCKNNPHQMGGSGGNFVLRSIPQRSWKFLSMLFFRSKNWDNNFIHPWSMTQKLSADFIKFHQIPSVVLVWCCFFVHGEKCPPQNWRRNARVIPQPGDGSCLYHSLSYGAGAKMNPMEMFWGGSIEKWSHVSW